MNETDRKPGPQAVAAVAIVALFLVAGCTDQPGRSSNDDIATQGSPRDSSADANPEGRSAGPRSAGTSSFVGTFYINYELDDLGTTGLKFRVPEGVGALNVTAYLEAAQQGPYIQRAYSNPSSGWTVNAIRKPPVDGSDWGPTVWQYAVPDLIGAAEQDAQAIQGPYHALLRDPEPGWWKFSVGGEGQNLRARWDLTFVYGEHDPGIVAGITQGVANSTVEVIGPVTIPWASTIAAGDRIHQNFTIGANASHLVAEMNAIVPREGPYYLTAKSEAERRFADVMIAQYHEETIWRKGLINPAAGYAEQPFVHEGPFNATIENPAEDTWKIVTIGMGENIQLQAMIYVTYPAPNA